MYGLKWNSSSFFSALVFLTISLQIISVSSSSHGQKGGLNTFEFEQFSLECRNVSGNDDKTIRRHRHPILLPSYCPEKILRRRIQKEKVERMSKRKRSANYTITKTTDFSAENKIEAHPTLSAELPTNLSIVVKVIPKIEISLISNYKEFMSDYEAETVNRKDGQSPECRYYGYLPKRLFALNSCAQCYSYVSPNLFVHPSKKWVVTETEWTDPKDEKTVTFSALSSQHLNLTVFANVSSPGSAILSSFQNERVRQKWLDCCLAAEKCCDRIQTVSVPPTSTHTSGTNSCPPTWDGWQCWNETRSGTTVHEPCPHYIYFSMTEVTSCPVSAEKVCESNGEWKKNKRNPLREWTDYSNCGSAVIESLKRRTYVHVLAYAFSIIAIIPALIVFFVYKQLRVDRIILHRNLFASMLVNGLVVIAFKTIVILSELNNESSPVSIINQNGVGCRLLFILTKYSRLTNYMWMFCEGYYLHKLIAAAFAEQKSLLIFYLIGWVFPIIPTLTYAIIRMSDDELNTSCWVVPKESIEWIFNGPSLLSLLINMLFLINIIRVLVTKLRAAHANEPSQYRKAVRATLVLLPLFGLHFVVTIYRPASGSGTCEWVEIYYHVNDVLDGLQGFLVALIFCYLNGEVVNLLKRTYGRWKDETLGAGCRRESSNSKLRSRKSHGGSMLRRSVISTQCYSPVSVSPEMGNATRLTVITPGTVGLQSNANGGNNVPVTLNNSACSEQIPGMKKQTVAPNGFGLYGTNLTLSPGNTLNHLNSIVKIRNTDGPAAGTWTEVQLNDLSSPDIAPTTSMEMKPQKNVRLSPTVTVNANGVKGEHQL